MAGQLRSVKAITGVSVASSQRAEALWNWLERHWYAAIAGVSAAIGGLLLATAAVPAPLTPLVLGPLGAVAMTALLAPRGDARLDVAAPHERGDR